MRGTQNALTHRETFGPCTVQHIASSEVADAKVIGLFAASLSKPMEMCGARHRLATEGSVDIEIDGVPFNLRKATVNRAVER